MKLKGKKDILPANSQKKESKTRKKTVIEFWNACVSTWFQFTNQRKGEDPTFDGVSQKSLQYLLKSLRERTPVEVEWTEKEATTRLNSFLCIAYRDKWLRDNWLMKNINSQKDKIFFQKDNNKNGHSTTIAGNQPFTREGVIAEFNRRNYNR